MRPPPWIHPLIVAREEAICRREGMDPELFWAVVTGHARAPKEFVDAWCEVYYPAVRREDFERPLTLPPKNDTKDSMDASTVSPARRGRPMANQDHPFVAALLREGITVAEVASDLRRAPSTVKAWYKTPSDPGFRPIPRDAAKAIQKRFKVPMSAWTRIAG